MCQLQLYFGDVRDNVYTEGLTFPVNPLLSFSDYDVREKALDVPKIPMPTKDQQTSFIDVSVIYNINATPAPAAKSDVGLAVDIVNVKVAPNLRSLLRSEGKAVVRCEDLFSETVQETMQANLQTRLQEKVGKYATIKSVLIRNIELPGHILTAIKNKKVREQAAEEQKAELRRFETEMEQKAVQAAAEKAAATERAEQVKILADAQAYEITKITEAIAGNPAYIPLEALKTLGEISKDPASKMYFMDGNSSMPLPLLHMGDDVRQRLLSKEALVRVDGWGYGKIHLSCCCSGNWINNPVPLFSIHSGVEQWLAYRSHTPMVGGSNPSPQLSTRT